VHTGIDDLRPTLKLRWRLHDRIFYIYLIVGLVVSQAVSRRLRTTAAQGRSQVKYVAVVALKQLFSPSASVFLENSHFTKCTTLICHPRLLQ
jgi:hypothetical protein